MTYCNEKPFDREEQLSEQVAHILQDRCPAFSYTPTRAGAVWHDCHCNAQQKPDASCICVWHLKASCPFGEWPKVAKVLAPAKRQEEKAAKSYQKQVEQAQKAIHGEADNG